MTPLRVLQFITPAGFYGAERWVIALANNTPHERMICDLAVTQESESQDLSVAEYYPNNAGDVHYLRMSGRFDFRGVSALVRVIRERQIDIIHTHGYKSDILGWLAARLAGIRCVSTPHGFSGNVGLKLGVFIRIGTYMLRHFDMVTPLSEGLVDDMVRLGVPARKTHFIRNGVDLLEIDRVVSKVQGLKKNTDGTRIIGFIGQLIPRKGLKDLLLAFDQLYKDDDGLRLELLGDGNEREDLEQLASSLPSGKAIRFLGFRSDRLVRLARFDLFVMTSSLEGIPRCLMEAMALRVPVVAYDIPGVDQLVEHGKTGLLAPHGDTSELARQCQVLLGDPELVKELTDAGREIVSTRYSASRMANEYEQLFLKILNRSNPGRAQNQEVG